MVQNLRIVQNFPPSSWILSPPVELRGGGQKNFPPPELNPVSAPVYIYIFLVVLGGGAHKAKSKRGGLQILFEFILK